MAIYTMEDFLRDIAPYVIVCGSFARGEETEESDIDCFLRLRPDYDPEADADESYMPEILEIVNAHNLIVDSVIVGHIAVEQQRGFPRMVEISWLYRLPKTETPYYRSVDGVSLMCCRDNKDANIAECYNGDDLPLYESE